MSWVMVLCTIQSRLLSQPLESVTKVDRRPEWKSKFQIMAKSLSIELGLAMAFGRARDSLSGNGTGSVPDRVDTLK